MDTFLYAHSLQRHRLIHLYSAYLGLLPLLNAYSRSLSAITWLGAQFFYTHLHKNKKLHYPFILFPYAYLLKQKKKRKKLHYSLLFIKIVSMLGPLFVLPELTYIESAKNLADPISRGISGPPGDALEVSSNYY
ncbi:hypothetical protein F5050DRAFT_1111521 [Lentinula boryana]|uniref:Uncharacterized protein n=1 Tax=Lentinula boryana TaxID=40481 RepID=A0ABQ8PZL0_9AGAR|nr:hypothetical protein F5050DRAFT_1111521 [Lentinula boryana]